MKNPRFSNIFSHTGGVAIITAVLFGSIGTYFVRASFAATYGSNPVAIADYCALEGSNTVLYGWAYDPEATAGAEPYVVVTVGGTAATVASDRAGYRDAPINAWLDSGYPGGPHPGTYGWRLQLSNLYKGNSYPVSGTVRNYGAGADVSLAVNSDHNVDGDTSKPYFAGKKVPDVCLATAPAPAPAPTPAPKPTPTPAPKVTAPKATTPAPPAAPAVSNAADAAVTTGSATATLSIPAGNANTVYIRYGTDANNLSRSSDIQTLSGATAIVKLEKLSGKTTYTYEIVRTQGAQVVTSPKANFTTKGYTLNLAFTDASGKPVKGISTQLGNGKPVKSGEDGTVVFKNLGGGSYSPIFTYNGQSYSQDFTTSSGGKASDDGTVVLSKTVDVSKLHKAVQPAKTDIKSGSNVIVIAVLVLLLTLVGGGIWWAVRRKRRLLAEAYGYRPTNYMPPVVNTPTPQLEPKPTAVVEAVAHHSKAKKHTDQAAPPPTHIGESLRDMVLQSMAQDTAQHPEHHNKKPPIVPGG